MNNIVLFLLGLGLVLLACTHRWAVISAFEQRLEIGFHRIFSQKPWIVLVRILWPIGRAETLMLLVVGLMIIKPTWGVAAGFSYLFWSAVDRFIKVTLNRKRPFDQFEEVAMLQPNRPHDPSFPSGDAFHIWFLVIVAMQAFQLGWLPILALIVLAVLVSLGRVAMGVHFPSDILAGAGLGLASAAFAITLQSIVAYLFLFK